MNREKYETKKAGDKEPLNRDKETDKVNRRRQAEQNKVDGHGPGEKESGYLGTAE
jgi:hypothetical protein